MDYWSLSFRERGFVQLELHFTIIEITPTSRYCGVNIHIIVKNHSVQFPFSLNKLDSIISNSDK